MDRIVIGKEYEKAFESVCTLLNNGSVKPHDVNVQYVSGDCIRTATHEFVLSRKQSSDRETERKFNFTEKGASWFEPLRGNGDGAGEKTAQWLGFIERVAQAYHRNYSLIEFKQPKNAVDDAQKERCRCALNNVVANFFPMLSGATIVDGSTNGEPDDVYGISLKASMSGGTGASIPVLCSVYFRKSKSSGKFEPISSKEADSIYKTLYNMIPDGSGERESGTDNTNMIDTVLSNLGALIAGKFEYYSFDDCVRFSERDGEAIDEIAEKLSHEDVNLECHNLTVLGISHVEWVNTAFYVSYNNKTVLKAIVGPEGTVSMTCENSHHEKLIDGNVIACRFKGHNGKVINKKLTIDPGREDLGLTQEQLEEVRTHSAIAKHLQLRECKNVPRICRDCVRCMCASQLTNLGTREEPVWVCGDCPYPEVVFEDENGMLHVTAKTRFARDKMALTEEPTKKCSCCGREFTERALNESGLCELCSKPAAGSSEGRMLYAKYRGMLSPLIRIKYARRIKACKEDNELIVFFMGSDRLIFDKKRLEREGYLDAPVDNRKFAANTAAGGKGGKR